MSPTSYRTAPPRVGGDTTLGPPDRTNNPATVRASRPAAVSAPGPRPQIVGVGDGDEQRRPRGRPPAWPQGHVPRRAAGASLRRSRSGRGTLPMIRRSGAPAGRRQPARARTPHRATPTAPRRRRRRRRRAREGRHGRGGTEGERRARRFAATADGERTEAGHAGSEQHDPGDGLPAAEVEHVAVSHRGHEGRRGEAEHGDAQSALPGPRLLPGRPAEHEGGRDVARRRRRRPAAPAPVPRRSTCPSIAARRAWRVPRGRRRRRRHRGGTG